MFGTPGGDAGEFLLAASVIMRLPGASMGNSTANLISSLFTRYLATEVSPARKFYMHTDEAGVDAALQWLANSNASTSPNLTSLDPFQNLTAGALSNPMFHGCGHLRDMLQYPADYQA